MPRPIDLRSDTVHAPTPAMRAAMAAAETGDDGYREDPTVARLEERVAALLGKEAGLFLPSATMANLIALMVLTDRVGEVAGEETCHVLAAEFGGLASVAHLSARALPGVRGAVDLELLARALDPAEERLRPPVRLVAVETTHTAQGGAVLPLAHLAALHRLCAARGVPVHLDGARIFNAAIALGRPEAEMARHAETTAVCLCKGLGAPVGAVLALPRAALDRALYFRRVLGGHMRQSGIVAAGAIVALDTMRDRLAEDHANAQALARLLAALDPRLVDPAGVESNLLTLAIGALGRPARPFAAALAGRGVRVSVLARERLRLCLHHEIGAADLPRVRDAFAALLAAA